MRLKNKLLLTFFLINTFLVSSIILLSLSIIKKEEKKIQIYLLKEKTILLEKNTLPFILKGSVSLLSHQAYLPFSLYPFILKLSDGRAFLFKEKNKTIKINKKESLRKNLKKMKYTILYEKPIKAAFSNYIWGTLFVCAKTKPVLLISPIPYRLFLVPLFYLIFTIITITALCPYKKFSFGEKRLVFFFPFFQQIKEEFNKLSEEKKNLEKRIKQLLNKKKNIKTDNERKKISERIKILTEMKKNLFEAQKNISSHNAIVGIAHEINNPLTTIIGYLQLLSIDKKIGKRMREKLSKNVETIFNTKEKLEKLIAASPEKTKEKINLSKFFHEFKRKIPFLKVKTKDDLQISGNFDNFQKNFSIFFNNLKEYSPKNIEIVLMKNKEEKTIEINVLTQKEVEDELSFQRKFLDFLVFFEFYGKIEFKLQKNKILLKISLIDSN